MQMSANVSPPGALNTSHAHPGVLKAAVYYIDMGMAPNDPEGGELYFEDPRFPVPHITFPGFVRHGVRPHRGSRDGVSIAMSISAKD